MLKPVLRQVFLAKLLLLALTASMVSVSLAASRHLQGTAGSPAALHTPIGPGVTEALQAQSPAPVVIFLARPPAMAARPLSRPSLRAAVAAVQQSVLASVTPADFAVRHRFRAVPALSGHVLTLDGLMKLAAHPDVVRIDLDVGGQAHLDVSVPLIGVDERHTQGNTGDGVVVAVLDSGLDTDHNDLQGDLLHEYCFLDNNGSIDGNGLCPDASDRQSGAGAAEDGAGHGTHVTGIITSDGIVSPVGVAPDAQIVAFKVLDDNNQFYFFSEIVAALDYIITDRPDVQVINMSLGTFATFAGDCDNVYSYNMAGAAAIDTLRALGVVSFASAGNNSSGSDMTSPACLSNTISVGATNDSDLVASFSNSNSATDIMAPGVSIVADGLANGQATYSGTSMASPHAAGCAALLIESGEATTPDEIETRLETSTIQVTDPTNGLTFPRIDCHPASAATPTATVTASATSTGTPTSSATPAPTASHTPTATPTTPTTATATPTATASPVGTLTSTATATTIATATATATATPTATTNPLGTATSTSTATPTATTTPATGTTTPTGTPDLTVTPTVPDYRLYLPLLVR